MSPTSSYKVPGNGTYTEVALAMTRLSLSEPDASPPNDGRRECHAVGSPQIVALAMPPYAVRRQMNPEQHNEAHLGETPEQRNEVHLGITPRAAEAHLG